MKIVISCVVLAALCLSVQAAPWPARSTVQLYKSLTKASSVKDIWSNCSAQSDPAKILNITISPDPPKKGATLKLTAVVDLDESVTSGQIEIDLKYGIFPVHQKTDLCDALKTAGQACPLEKGIQTLSIVETIPSAAPGGHYTGNAYVRDQSGKELVCIALNFRL